MTECIISIGRVVAAGGVAGERTITNSCVESAGGVASECNYSYGRIAVKLAAVGGASLSLRQRRKAKTAEPQYDEKHCDYLVQFDESIHNSSFLSFSPLSCFFGTADPEGAKNLAGQESCAGFKIHFLQDKIVVSVIPIFQ